MQTYLELTCTDCNNVFQSAALLLQHFAEHAANNSNYKAAIELKMISDKQTKIPNLYPIKKKNRNSRRGTVKICDPGVEDKKGLNVCLIEMNEHVEPEPINSTFVQNKCIKDYLVPTEKMYQCMYCSKRFKWSTNLNKHILVHTGEQFFLCKLCNTTFTRNFLLQRHQRKVHFIAPIQVKLPELKPISEIINKKNRKQNKCQIKRQATYNDHNMYFIRNLNGLFSPI